MTAKTTATRAEAIAAAIDKFHGADTLPYWADGGPEADYMHGMCAVIADTFGTDDPENARSEVWEEMRIAFEHEKRRAEAESIAACVWKDHMLNGGSIQDMLKRAALAGIEAAS